MCEFSHERGQCSPIPTYYPSPSVHCWGLNLWLSVWKTDNLPLSYVYWHFPFPFHQPRLVFAQSTLPTSVPSCAFFSSFFMRCLKRQEPLCSYREWGGHEGCSSSSCGLEGFLWTQLPHLNSSPQHLLSVPFRSAWIGARVSPPSGFPEFQS